MRFRLSGLRNAEREGSGPASTQGAARVSLSKLQSFVSLAAGIVSITGALVAIPKFFKPAPGKGELVAIVQDAKTAKALPDATIEVLTPHGVLVETLTPNSLGKASCT